MRRMCFTLTRSLVIVVNLVAAVLAALLIYISFTAFDKNYELDSLSDSHPRLVHTYVSIVCAGIGLIIVLLSLLGFIGAIRKSKSALATYVAVVILMVSILIVMVIMTYSMNNSMSVNRELDKSLVNSTVVVYNYVEPSDMKTRIIDNIQKSFSCCGVNSPADWLENPHKMIPRSCCSSPVQQRLPTFTYCDESDYKIGCWKALVDHFHANLSSVRTILYIFITFGLVCSSAASFMILALRRSLDVV